MSLHTCALYLSCPLAPSSWARPRGPGARPGGPPVLARVMNGSPHSSGRRQPAGEASQGSVWRTKTHPFSMTSDSMYRKLSKRMT